MLLCNQMVAFGQADVARTSKVSCERMRTQRAVIDDFTAFLEPAGVLTADGYALQAFLDARRAEGKHANTLRKERTMIRSFFASAWRTGRVSAETLMSIQSVPPPAGSTPVAQAKPYTRTEIRDL